MMPQCVPPQRAKHILHNTDHNVSQGKTHHIGITSKFFKCLKLCNSGQDLATYFFDLIYQICKYAAHITSKSL